MREYEVCHSTEHTSDKQTKLTTMEEGDPPNFQLFVYILDALCNEGCEGHGTANGLPQPRMELAERSHEHTYWGRSC